MDDDSAVRRGFQAKAIIDSPLWAEAWEAYRARVMEIIEKADSASVDTIMQAKRLLTAGLAAKAHLERVIQDGSVAAQTIELEEQRKKSLFQRWGRVA